MASERDLQTIGPEGLAGLRYRLRSLEGKLILAMTAINLLVVGSIALVANWLTLEAVERRLTGDAWDVAETIAQRLETGFPTPQALHEILSEQIRSHTDVESIAVFAPSAEGELEKVVGVGVDVTRFRAQREAFETGAQVSRRFAVEGRGYLLSAGVPILSGGRRLGAVGVWSSPLAMEVLVQQNRRRILIAAPVSVLLLVLMLRVVFNRFVHRPLRDLERAMTRAGAGDFHAEAAVVRRDELGYIASRYNSMLSHIRGVIEEREELHDRVKRFNEELETKVAESTRELEEKNRELRRLNEDLYYIQRRLARMERVSAAQHVAARFAHKIGTPLNLVSGHIQVLLQAEQEDEALIEKLQLIQSQIDKLEGIVRDLLDETRKPVLQFETFDLNQLLDRICALVEPTFAVREVRIDKKFSADLIPIVADEAQLEQVFLNLFNNSLDAMPEGGTITVQTEKSEDGVRVELGDTGEGMTESALSQMFRPFFTTKEVGRGTGLGLSIVKGILTAHGATIDAESELGRGTTFTLIFPVTGTDDAEVSHNGSALGR